MFKTQHEPSNLSGKKELVAHAYKPNPKLENLVDRFEDSAYRGGSVKITTSLEII